MSGFVWRDGPRTVVYGPGAAARLHEFGWAEFQLVTTERLLQQQAALPSGTGEPLVVGPGQVPELAAALLPLVRHRRLVAWGGGRVIDVAKALAAAHGGEVCAVPTTLSGAEMSGGHRQAPGYEDRPRVRPVLVLADPAAMTSLPEQALRASALNALAHAAEALYTPLANPVATMVALRGAELLAGPDLALGSLLAGYAIDSAGFALHHVLCQSLVRVCGTPHAETNAAVLPHTLRAVTPRAPDTIARLAAVLGTDAQGLPARVTELGGGLRRLRVDPACAVAAADAALARSELGNTPGPPLVRDELVAIIRAASG
jgi:alcohol dehydrogenase class IV